MTTYTTTRRLYLCGEEEPYVGWDASDDHKIVPSTRHQDRERLFYSVVHHNINHNFKGGYFVAPRYETHNPRLSFGMELEMVIAEWSKEKTGFLVLEGSLGRIKWADGKTYRCEIYRGTGAPDRSKFLIMKDGR